MPYPPFENSLSVTDFVRIEGSGKESTAKYNIPHDLESDRRSNIIIVVGKHKYYTLFSVQLVEYAAAENGAIKGPLKILKPIDLVWKNNDATQLKFYLAVIKFQSLYEKSLADIESLKALIQNPHGYEFYFHDYNISEKITPRSITPIRISNEPIDVVIQVDRNENEYSIQCDVKINKTRYPFQRLHVQFDYFIVCEQQWILCNNVNVMHVVAYFKECNNILALPIDQFDNFQHDVLQKMEMNVAIEHTYIKTQRADVKKKPLPLEKIIYLSDLENYVAINPVMKYGAIEIPVLTKKQIYQPDSQGRQIWIERNGSEEDNFIALLIKQRSELVEQLENPLLYFYIPKKEFVNEQWFLSAFDDWQKHSITILGFNNLKENKLNQHKASINIIVSSGINWFNAAIKVRFGKAEATLKQLHKAVKNKSKFIQLDDGTLGILPQAWLKKLSSYFKVGEITQDQIQISKSNYSLISTLYDERELEDDVKDEIKYYQAHLGKINTIKPVTIPKTLTGTLRHYQHQGVSWLNFLDDANFGGCLADDMGLGKSIQIIAFILTLNEKRITLTHLLVVPTTLVYTWQQEFQKFASHTKIYVHHGNNRKKVNAAFKDYDVVITTYGTLISDITFLSKYNFEYIFLDESQNIKNPSSQRYQATRLLNSKNKIIITGTPIENNTFDLFAQFSFACPGLLGTKQYFRDTFAIPIDKFKSRRKLLSLQAKINPFILRRTKDEVAKELPDKTEMIIYCDMDVAQRAVYDRYEKEFRDFISSEGDDIPKYTIHILKGLTCLRQICNAPVLVEDTSAGEDGSTKIDMLMERITNLSGKHKIVVFSQFVAMLDLVKARLKKEDIPHAYLTGSTQRRDRVVDRFQNNDEVRVFLISLKAGGVGLNLTAADYVFIVDPWWNPAVENQAIDRIHRIGQEKNVVAVRLICKNTIEEKMMLMQQSKMQLQSDLLSTDTSLFKRLKKKDFLELVSH